MEKMHHGCSFAPVVWTTAVLYPEACVCRRPDFLSQERIQEDERDHEEGDLMEHW